MGCKRGGEGNYCFLISQVAEYQCGSQNLKVKT